HHFQTISDDKRVIGCAALWDQRAFKQTVVRGYSARLKRLRPLINVFAKLSGRIRLPSCDSNLSNAFLSPIAVPEHEHSALLALINQSLSTARQRRIETVTLGFAMNDSRLEIVRREFRCREYRTRLYRVRWPELETKVG